MRTYNVTLSVAAIMVSIVRSDPAQAPTGIVDIVSDGFPILHAEIQIDRLLWRTLDEFPTPPEFRFY